MFLTKDNFDFFKKHGVLYAGTITTNSNLNPLKQTIEDLQQVVHKKGGKDFAWMAGTVGILRDLGIDTPDFEGNFIRLSDYEGKELYAIKNDQDLRGLLMGSGSTQDWYKGHNYVNIVKITDCRIPCLED